MPPLTEADTRAKLIDPKLKLAGWGESQIEREHYFRKGVDLTRGRIYLVGKEARRGKPKRVDYLLRYNGMPIAVLEAKEESRAPDEGLEQAKEYASLLDVPFAYSSNGHKFVEYDFLSHQSQESDQFPAPGSLWSRWDPASWHLDPRQAKAAETPVKFGDKPAPDPLLYAYCPPERCGNLTPHYFQEVAIRRIIERIVAGRKRILLAMATGTGKTFISLQIAWKLIRSQWLNRRHPERPGRILFLADRVILRDQAYNKFSAFADGASDPRHILEGHPPKLTRDLYFGIYQSLWSEGSQDNRLFEKFPKDFFDLIIIDECHRSGFGTWREILEHFHDAIHLGMTATPKQDDNIDTYLYFCTEEPEIVIDPNDPDKGTWRPPAYQYSLGQGIEDGFLATYRVHRVRTTVDASGLHLREAIEEGAEVLVPDGVDAKEIYYTPQFEREITLPDRSETIVKHLAGLLKKFDPMEKTMVFCVDIEHAALVARLLQNEFAYLGSDLYAVPIVSEEGERAREWLESFADSDRKFPVVATTAELLSTGVDVPACRNIVFIKTLSSPVLFKQIIGRGSRVDPATGKLWFRIIDYTGATRLFDVWDRPPTPPPQPPEGPQTAGIQGRVFNAKDMGIIAGASVFVRTGPNTVLGPNYTDSNGAFSFKDLPEGRLELTVQATGFRTRSMRVDTSADMTTFLDVEPHEIGKSEPVAKIRVKGLDVTIADEAIFIIETTGEQLSFEQYTDFTRRNILKVAPREGDLRGIWIDPGKRRNFLEDLRTSSIHPEVIAEVMGRSDADQFDLLSHIAFGGSIKSRDERAIAFRNREQHFIEQHGERAKKVILGLLEKYRVSGVEEISDARVFSIQPFRDMGGAIGISQIFGGIEGLQSSMKEMQARLYVSEAVA
jgi:type I restriction enzyme R subunit